MGANIGKVQCGALIAAGLRDQLLLPGDARYEARINSYWSASARQHPACIVEPQTAKDVATAVRAIAGVGVGNFAVRSGGHSHWAGGSNVENGVTVDLGNFNKTTYDPATKLASLGPAQRWGDVFLTLEALGVIVPGGRDGNVGVGGLLTGGGNSYYTGRHGFVCDSSVNAEIVLADGSIVEANEKSNPDLWKALKGGLGNFGIVTRFDVEAFESGQLWGGIRTSDKSHQREIIDALVKFTDDNHKNPEAAFIINFTYQPAMGADIVIAQALIDTDGVENPPVFEDIQKVPELFRDIKKRPMSGVANDYVLPSGLRYDFFLFFLTYPGYQS
jgi:FAD/FMN-containing dehydrogenase